MATKPRPKIKIPVSRQVNLDTKFQIDYDWWEKSTLDLKSYITARLQALGVDDIHFNDDVDEVDLVDMETGEVRRVEGFQFVIHNYFSKLPSDFASQSSLVDAVFCVLLANANQPMTAQEIAEKIGRSSEVVLRTLGGKRIYQGISPMFD